MAHPPTISPRSTPRWQAQKAEVIAQANAQKAVLAKEVKSLRAELDRVGDSKLAGGAPMIPLSEGEQALADALKKRREFEGPCPVFRWLFALRKGERSVPRCPGGVDVSFAFTLFFAKYRSPHAGTQGAQAT